MIARRAWRIGLPLWTAGCAIALAYCGARSSATAQPAKPTDPPRAAFLGENEKWLSDSLGKLTEEEIVKKLGPPDRLALQKVSGEERTEFIWEDVSRVVVDFSADDGKAVAINGTFSPHVKAKKLTLENFRKLKLGMSEAEVGKLIGGEKGVGTVTVEYVVPKGEKNAKLNRVEWTASRRLRLWFDKGKLAGVVGGGGLRE